MKEKLKNIIASIFWFDVFLLILAGFTPSLPSMEEVYYYILIAILSISGFFLQRKRYKVAAIIIICFSLFCAYSSYRGSKKFNERVKSAQSEIARTQNDPNHFQDINEK